MKKTFGSTKLLMDHFCSCALCSSVNGMFLTGNQKQAMAVAIDKIVANQIMKSKPTVGSNSIPIKGPTAAAKLVLNP